MQRLSQLCNAVLHRSALVNVDLHYVLCCFSWVLHAECFEGMQRRASPCSTQHVFRL